MIMHMRHSLWTGISETNVDVITSATRTHPLPINKNGYPLTHLHNFETYLHTSHCIHLHFAQCQIYFRRVHDLNEQVSSSCVGSAPHSPSCCWEISDVFVTHFMGKLVRALGLFGQCVCHADNEVVQTVCSGAR